MPELIDQIKAKEREMTPLWNRMDADRDLINIASRVLFDTANPPKQIPNSVFVPLNDIIVFASTVESYLGDFVEQVVVSSEDKDFPSADIEALIRAIWRNVDSRWRKGIGTGGRQLTWVPFTDQQATRRGRTAHLCIFRIENGELITDIRGWDTRFTTFAYDKDGLAWVSHLMTRAPDLIAQDYPRIKLPDKRENIELRDIWTRKENIVHIEGQEALNEPHSYGQVPVVLETVPMGAMTYDDDSLKYEGESIFLMIRDIFPELMRYASIIQSLNMKELDHALQERGLKPEDMDGTPPPEHDAITDPRRVTMTTGEFAVVPIGELKAMAESLHQMLETRMQRGGINNFDMGTFNQAMSAVALIRVGQGRDKVYGPRIGTRGLAKQDLTEMAIKQILEEAERAKVKQIKIGRQTFDLSILQQDYELEFKYSVKDTTVDAARQSIASAQRGLLSDYTIRRETLQMEDPDDDERRLRMQELELLVPEFKLYLDIKAAKELGEKGDEDAEIGAALAEMKFNISVERMAAGQFEPLAAANAPNPTQPVNIFDTGTASPPKQQGVAMNA